MPRQAARAEQGADAVLVWSKIVLYLVLVAVVGLVGVAIFSDLPAPARDVELPVEAK